MNEINRRIFYGELLVNIINSWEKVFQSNGLSFERFKSSGVNGEPYKFHNLQQYLQARSNAVVFS